ncbi:hypothetical protein Mgra_00008646 [Meloidogyne graminicola]|uniref:Uncharacterized protein n=1 Tax=Meloidogyne graminicola TaxID=189291 RepID=A0A8S9ZF78_9BILA|nr:hypothetical protein Mgra_00008646 [Meloidogyne graminicola]
MIKQRNLKLYNYFLIENFLKSKNKKNIRNIFNKLFMRSLLIYFCLRHNSSFLLSKLFVCCLEPKNFCIATVFLNKSPQELINKLINKQNLPFFADLICGFLLKNIKMPKLKIQSKIPKFFF